MKSRDSGWLFYGICARPFMTKCCHEQSTRHVGMIPNVFVGSGEMVEGWAPAFVVIGAPAYNKVRPKCVRLNAKISFVKGLL